MRASRSYPISLSRLRRGAGCVVLALMVLGIAASAGSAFAAGGCCVMPAEHGSSEGPCHSVAPTSCCEANAAGQLPGLPGAPAFVPAAGPCVLSGHPLPGAYGAPPPAPAARIALATIVLRL